MKKVINLLIVILIGWNANSFAQGKISRPTQQQSQTDKPKKSPPKVTVSEPDGYINGHGFVDLGLPSGTKWSTCNIGAKSPEEKGKYFAWGETKTTNGYQHKCVAWGKTIETMVNEGIIDSSETLCATHDAATVNWGNPWRTPTSREQAELLHNCVFDWISDKDNIGFIAVGPNGKSIFLPAAGRFEDDKLQWYTIYHKQGFYMSSSVLDSQGRIFFPHLDLYQGYSGGGNVMECYYGFSVRPIIR